MLLVAMLSVTAHPFADLTRNLRVNAPKARRLSEGGPPDFSVMCRLPGSVASAVSPGQFGSATGAEVEACLCTPSVDDAAVFSDPPDLSTLCGVSACQSMLDGILAGSMGSWTGVTVSQYSACVCAPGVNISAFNSLSDSTSPSYAAALDMLCLPQCREATGDPTDPCHVEN